MEKNRTKDSIGADYSYSQHEGLWSRGNIGSTVRNIPELPHENLVGP